MKEAPLKKLRAAFEKFINFIFLLCGILSVILVLFISIYLIISGIPAIRQIGLVNFLCGRDWSAGSNRFGILPFILTSVYGTAGAV